MEKKEFSINGTLDDVMYMNDGSFVFGEAQEHFGVEWRTYFAREDDKLLMRLDCGSEEGKWFVEVEYVLKFATRNGTNEIIAKRKFRFQENLIESYELYDFEDLKDFVVDGKLSIWFDVKIIGMGGIDGNEYTEEMRDLSGNEQRLVIIQVFDNVPDISEEMSGDEKCYKNLKWYYNIYRDVEDDNLEISLNCENPHEAFGTQWFIDTDYVMKIITKNEEKVIQRRKYWFQDNNTDTAEYLKWSELEKYLDEGKLTVQVEVNIFETNGIKKKFRNFDESMKEFSDVALVVEEEKFYVSKLFISSQSVYFKTLLLGKFEEANKSEITLDEISSYDFQNFLEVIHGEPAIEECTIDGILELAHMYDSEYALKRSETFLMEESNNELKENLELAMKFKLKSLKEHCLSKIETVEDIRSVLQDNLEEMDPSVLAHLLQKSLDLHE